MILFRVLSIYLIAVTAVQASQFRGTATRDAQTSPIEDDAAATQKQDFRRLMRPNRQSASPYIRDRQYGTPNNQWGWGGGWLPANNYPQSYPCEWDYDCAWNYGYCSEGVCRQHGMCDSDLDCMNPSNRYPTSRCAGSAECLDNGYCFKRCGRYACDDEGTPPVNCLVSPCEALPSAMCMEERPTWCVVDYCSGSCEATYINAAGFEVCHGDGGGEPSPPTSYSCEKNSDCQRGQYCADGMCLDGGSCNTVDDCINPSNIYPVIECVGPLTCNEGTCGRECTGSFCENEEDEFFCIVPPCQYVDPDCALEAPFSCVNDYCGGCNAIRFGADGSRVCTDSSVPLPPLSPDECQALGGIFVPDIGNGEVFRPGYVCESSKEPPLGVVVFGASDPLPIEGVVCCEDMGNGGSGGSSGECRGDNDCDIDEYCQGGVCSSNGSCSSVTDCFNPANMYADILCFGPVTCEGGQCGRDCNGLECADGSQPVNCFARPCDVISEKCAAQAVSCVDDYCGGCNAYAYDAAGNLCTSDADPEPPMNNRFSPDECEAMGGVITYDIGDGSVHRPEYLCPYSGEPPFGPIAFPTNGPRPREGAVCCGGGDPVDSYTPEECETIGGVIMYDIGDGSVHRPGYLCPGNNEPPFGPIEFPMDGPRPIEGAVCCGAYYDHGESGSESGDSCYTDHDCGEEHHCQRGTCQANGSCSTDVDCMNPANIYPVIACVGHVSCMEGVCGKICGESNCPPGVQQYQCKVSPCEFYSDDCESYHPVSCVDNYCGGCNAVRFDAGGHHVCRTDDS